MSNVTWNKPFNYYDIVQAALRGVGVREQQTPAVYYGDVINNAMVALAMPELRQQAIAGGMIEAEGAPGTIPVHHAAGMGVIEPMAELMWHTFNRPTWFCDKTMLELLRSARIDDDLRNIHWPSESLYICFEKGCELNGFDLRSIMVFTPRSEITADTIRRAVRRSGGPNTEVVPHQMMNTLIGVWVDCLEGPEYELRQDGFLKTRNRLYLWRRYERPNDPDEKMENVDERERRAIHEGMHIAAAAMLYHAARPELVAPYQMPRSQRYTFRGDRSNFRRMTLPGVKVIHDPSRESAGVGSPKAPHYRGFVLRTLRAPRYRRNEDGTFRTVLVPPTAIHPELMDENPSHAYAEAE